MALNRYRLLSFDRQMGIGVAEAMQVTVSAVAKGNCENAPYCVPNEMICAEIGRFLRLPVPPSGIVLDSRDKTKAWFASMDFNLTGNSLPPIDPPRCWEALPGLCTGLLVFDALVANSDRHRRNLAVDFASKSPRMSIFDHSHALFGNEHGKARDRLARLCNRLAISGGPETSGNRHCFLDVISTDEHLSEWISRVQALPDYLIDGLCMDSIEVGASAEESDEAARFLKHRRDQLRKIIDENKAEFTGIKAWRLPL